MTKSVLCVDDEPNVLRGIERQFYKRYEIITAVGPDLGLRAIEERGPFAVVVSDLRMPGMDGIQFLARVRENSPDTVRIMLTGQADLEDAIAAVNQGNIFQFLTKPCPSDMLARALDAAIQQHTLITAERELLEKTLVGSVGVMAELLSLVNPAAFSRTQRIRHYVRQLAEKLEFKDRWQCDVAAMLCQIGSIAALPGMVLKQRDGAPPEPAKAEVLGSHRLGHDLLVRIPRMEDVAAIVLHQTELWRPGAIVTSAQTRGHLLRVALDFDERLTLGGTPGEAIAWMRGRRAYHPKFLEALEAVQVEESQSEVRALSASQLRNGMIINADVRSKTNLLLLAKGQEVTESALTCLRSFASTTGIREPISVIVPSSLEAIDGARQT